MKAVAELRAAVGVKAACGALELARSTYYRAIHPPPPQSPRPRTPSPRALGAEERSAVLAVLHSERFIDRSPGEVYATLLDEARYLCSVRTMYRSLKTNQEVRERRDQCRHPAYEHARTWCRHFLPWYNTEHRHSGIAYLTPAMVHYGQADDILATRRRVLEKAQAARPERFVRGVPSPQPLPAEVWINPPEDRTRTELQITDSAQPDHDMELLH